MFCEAIAIMVKKTMTLHDFVVDGLIYRQSEGGAIGMDLTGVVSDIYMCHWDQQVIAGLQANGMVLELYKRYKDDVNLIFHKGGEEEDESRKEIMIRVKRIADDVDPNLKVTTDNTADQVDGKLPVLDLKVWIDVNKNGIRKVLHTHYTKEVASKATIDWRSSHSNSLKRNVMVNEIIRIYRNCSDELPEEDVIDHLVNFGKRMQFSGYPEAVRQEVFSDAILRREMQLEREGLRRPDARGARRERY